MKASHEDSSDGDFWDIGEEAKAGHRKKPKNRGSFPSLSVYISCQEEAAKDDSGNTVSINIPDIANVSKLRINQQKDKREQVQQTSETNIDKELNKEDDDAIILRTQVDSESYGNEEKYDENELLYSSDELEHESGQEGSKPTSPERSSDEEAEQLEESEDGEDSNDVLFFDNSEPKHKKIGKEKEAPVLPPQKTRLFLGQDKSHGSGRLCPPRQLLKHWLYRGRKLLVADDGPTAVDAFVRAFALARIVHGTTHWRTARCKVFLARTYFYLMNYCPQAISHSMEASNVINACLSSSVELNKRPQVHHTLAWAYLVEGEAKTSLKMNQPAFPSLSKSLFHTKEFDSLISQRKKLKPSMQMDDPIDMTLKILCAQAKLCEATNNLYKARNKLEEALKRAESTEKGELRELRSGCVLKTLGEFLITNAGKTREGAFTEEDTKKELDEGLHCLKKSLKYIKKNKKPGSAKECELRFLIARHNLKHGLESRKNIWWELHKLKIWSSRIHGELSPQTKPIQDCLIQVLIKEENYDEALNELNSLLIATQNALGEYNPQVCGILRQLISVHLLKGNLAKALTALEQSLKIEMFLYGSSSRRVQTLKLKIKDLLFQVPPETRKKMLKRFPELRQKPPFKSYC